MPVVYSLQPTFSGGEIAPSLRGRVDLAKYATGLKKCLNFIIHPHGGASNRPGFKFIATSKYADKKCRLVGFEFSVTQAYMIEFGYLYARFYMNSDGVAGQIQSDPTLRTDFVPSAAHVAGDWTKCGRYRTLDCGSGKILYLSMPYGDTHTTTQIAMASNVSDSLTAVYSAGTLSIGLANATPSKNSADLVQAAVRASNAIFAAAYVTENAAYAAARPTTGVSIAASVMTTCDLQYFCILGSALSATNTNHFPPAETTYWTAQSIYEVLMPYLEADLPDLKFTQSADVLYIVHPDYEPLMLTRLDHSDWSTGAFEFVNGPFMPSNTDTGHTLTSSTITVGTSSTVTSSKDLFTSDHVGALLEIDHDIPSQTVSGAFTGNASSSTIMGMGDWRLITHGTWTGKITVQKSLDGGSNWVEVRVFTSTADFNVNTYGSDDNGGSAAIYRLTMSSFSSGTCNYDITMEASTTRGILKITAYSSATQVTATVLNQVGKTSASTDWAEGSWSDERGWPSSVEFFQDRLCFGSTDTEPQTCWMSKTGEYVDFGTSDPLEDSDSISISLPSRKMNGIKNMIPLGELLVLTASSEWSVGAGSGEPVTPTTVTTKSHGFRGTKGIDAVVIGNRVVYVQPQGTVMRDLGYDFSSDSYTGDDISLISNHLFNGYEITELCYQQEPDSLVWAKRDDGALLSATYLREQQVLAWAQHETDGKFESIATIPGDGYDQVWAVIQRGSARFIELMAERMKTKESEDQFFVDCGISYYGGARIQGCTAISVFSYHTQLSVEGGILHEGDLIKIKGLSTFSELNGKIYKVAGLTPVSIHDYFFITDPDTDAYIIVKSENTYENSATYFPDCYCLQSATTISGLSHLEGKRVSVLADGVDLPKKLVTGGEITLTNAAYIVHAGLPYDCDIQTLSIEVQAGDGTVQGRKLRCSKVTTRLLNSRGGLLGPDEDHLYDMDTKSLARLEDPLALLSGDVPQTIASDWDNGGSVFFRQNKPLPTTILAFMPVLTVGG